MGLRLFAFFHMNLAFSSIEEQDRPKVLEHAYWPLMRLAEERALPFAFEATAWTLETIRDLDSDLFDKFKELVTIGPCEFVGSGYTQMIGPLGPADVNAANQRLGVERYQDLLGLRPKIALINEQAYAAGLIPHYRDTGYDAVIMEWDNPSRTHPEWPYETRYQAAHVQDANGETFPVIWNHSIAFQKVQRYAHGDLSLDGYMSYLQDRLNPDQHRYLSLYGNDAEVFDFRPGRFMTESPLHDDGEWARLEVLFDAVAKADNFSIVPITDVLRDIPDATNATPLRLESPEQPVPVKKQSKYNIVRWSVSGRDDLEINTRCWRIYAAITSRDDTTDDEWRELLYLWSSDFRTHITEKRWVAYLDRLSEMERRVFRTTNASSVQVGTSSLNVSEDGSFITVSNDRLSATFNTAKGLALDGFIDRDVSDTSCIGTLHHGYFDDIQWGADFFTGHMVFAPPGARKVADLESVSPVITEDADGISLSAKMDLAIGAWTKTWRLDAERGTLSLNCTLDWAENVERGSFRLGFTTLNPAFFNASKLRFRTHNGGHDEEIFNLDGHTVAHGEPLSLLLSAAQALGLTEGSITIGDGTRAVKVAIDKTASALIGLFTHQPTSGTHFTRVEFSGQEIDDTFKDSMIGGRRFEAGITYRIVKDR